MAEAVVSFALERIKKLLAEEYELLSGVKDNVEDLKARLELMQSFLKDADERQDENHLIRTCVSKIRDLAFTSENVLENYATQVATKREREGFRKFIGIISEFIPRHQVASEIVKIQNDITKCIERLKEFKIIQGPNSSTACQREVLLRTIYPHQIEKDFVGMVKDQEQLVSHLMSMDIDDAFITIKGMGGGGKTTMASRIYNHKDVRNKFSNFAWVCVTQTLQKKTIWQDILKTLCPENRRVMEMGDAELAEALYNIQQEKKCLVVLDDIWTTEDWQSLSPGFPVGDTNNGGSKLLLTTRNIEVGRVHELGGLVEDEAWLLLQKKAFPGNEDNPGFQIQPEIEKLGRDIVKKCERLPLAISVLGGILKDKSTLEEWQMLSNNISKYLTKGKGFKESESVINVLGLSYNELPYFLKPCFLYLASFPEDFEISVEELRLLWIGEGFVYSSDRGEGETMMDVSRKYLNELAQKSMVTLISDEVGGDERCRLHDLMREMCISQGKKDEFFTVIDHQVSEQNPRLVFSPNPCWRRLALSFDRFQSVEIPIKQHDTVSCIGSLILRGPYSDSTIAFEAPGIQKFRYLRALKVEGNLSIQYEDLERISKLIHLRLLIFKGCTVGRFPSSISTLPYLETLGLEVINWDVIIPNTLGRMKQLRHLFLPNWRYQVEGGEKLRLDGLVNVELLSGVNPKRCRVEDIGMLNRLHTLRVNFHQFIEDGTDEEMRCLIENMNIAANSRFHLRNTTLYINSEIFSSEDTISHLQDLFHCLALQKLTIWGQINKLPEPNHYHQFTSSLTSIKLILSKLKEDPMKTLEKLPNLQTLCLMDLSFVGEEMVCSKEGFPQLKTLQLSLLYYLKKWEVEDGAMPKLHYLSIEDCDELEMVPYGFKFLKALKQLEIGGGMPDIAKRVGVEGEDFEKVQHVPSITCHQW